MPVINIPTSRRVEFIDITKKVQRALSNAGIQSGLCHVFVPHTTAGVTINENADPDVVRDIVTTLERLVPERGDYRHGEGNSDAHIKASIMGFSQSIPVENGRLALGTWQGVYFCEFDGPRTRQMRITLLPTNIAF